MAMNDIMTGAWIFAVVLQSAVGLLLAYPILLRLASLLGRKNSLPESGTTYDADYAVIVTAYQQADQLPYVIDSILKSGYANCLIYVVADNCDTSGLAIADERVILLKPERTLANNIKSHFYAIDRFRRDHERLVIIDSDNLVGRHFFSALNAYFDAGYVAVQGVRKAKNMNTAFACLDEAGDMYYRYVDRKLLFETGSSASLAGSGMAFTTAIYKECLAAVETEGAGFDKILQYELVKRDLRIAFAEDAVVYDEKTAKADQLVRQRARWINTWFKFLKLGGRLLVLSFGKLSYNQLAFSVMLCRPPLFMLLSIAGVGVVANLLAGSAMAIYWLCSIACFIYLFFAAIRYFDAPRSVYRAIRMIPVFCFYQVLALFNAKKANRLSVATQHGWKAAIEELDRHSRTVDTDYYEKTKN